MSASEKTDAELIEHLEHLLNAFGNSTDYFVFRELVKRYRSCQASVTIKAPPSSNS